VREIRTLREMWRALETGPRQLLTGHEEGNLGYTPRRSLPGSISGAAKQNRRDSHARLLNTRVPRTLGWISGFTGARRSRHRAR
jgi:hypothetical protein